MHRTARLAALAAPFALSGCFFTGLASHVSTSYAVRRPVHQRLSAAGLQQLQVADVAGRIAIVAWPRPIVDVQALVHGAAPADLAQTHVVITRSGGDLSVRTHYDNAPFTNRQGAAVDYTIHVPAALAIHVANVSGPISLEGVSGGAHVADVDGDIRVDGSGGSTHLATTAGDISLSMPHFGAGDSIDAATVSGSITVRLARNAGAKVHATSISGRFSSDFPIRSHAQNAGTDVNAAFGSGSGSVHLSTISGNIAIDALR